MMSVRSLSVVDWFVTVFLLGVTVFTLAGLFGVAGCGTGGDEAAAIEGRPITSKHQATFLAIEQCSGLSAPDPLERAFSLKPCPTSHRLCCMDDPRFPDFVATNGKLSGYAGSFDGDRTIALPVGTPCGDAFDHEAYRYLLRANGDARWGDFDLPNLPEACPEGIQ